MVNSKLTLSTDKETIRQAKRIARENKTSVSAMFSRYIKNLTQIQESEEKLGPLTLKATGLMKKVKGKSYKELLEESLLEKHSK